MKLTRKAKRVVTTITVILIISITIGVPMVLYSSFLAAGTVNVASDVLKSLVDANAALLGFLGVITIYALTSYNDFARTTEEQIYRVRLEHQQETRENSTTGYTNIETNKTSRRKDALFTKRIKKLENRMQDLRDDSKSACVLCVVSATLFVTSILFSLLAMSEVPVFFRLVAVYSAACLCIMGVVTILGMVLDFRSDWD